MDGRQFDYNGQSEVFGTAGSISGGWAGAEAVAATGSAIEVWIYGVGVVSGTIMYGGLRLGYQLIYEP